MATANQSIPTPFGAISQVTTGAGQTVIHTLANWMWLPMILMGVMAIATAVGLGIAQAQVSSDIGEQFTALRQANFETLKPLTGGFTFLGLALILSGIAFLLGTILGALRWGGGEVQEAVEQPVMALKMPWSAKLFLVRKTILHTDSSRKFRTRSRAYRAPARLCSGPPKKSRSPASSSSRRTRSPVPRACPACRSYS